MSDRDHGIPPEAPGSNDGESRRPRHSPSDPSVLAEPWMQKATFQPATNASYGPASDQPGSVAPEHSVWDEPGLSQELSGELPADAVTWFRYYCEQKRRTSAGKSWLVTCAVILFAGPAAIFGTILSSKAGNFPIVYYSILGPTIEELMKLAIVLWIVETRPWYFRSSIQILTCMVMSGLIFAAVENVLYLEWSILDPSPELAHWRWTVCVALHTSCCTVAGCGASSIWRNFQTEERPPRMQDGAKWIITAITIHGLYNFSMIMVELFKIDIGL